MTFEEAKNLEMFLDSHPEYFTRMHNWDLVDSINTQFSLCKGNFHLLMIFKKHGLCENAIRFYMRPNRNAPYSKITSEEFFQHIPNEIKKLLIFNMDLILGS